MACMARRALRPAALAILLVTGACASDNTGKNEALGTVLGAAAGGLIGAEIGGRGESQAVGAALGTFTGALIGNSIGRRLDEADRIRMEQAHQRALESSPSGTRTEWYNPDSGNRGWVEPEPAYQDRAGRYCREYTQTIYVGGEPVEGYGTACRMPDGSWRIVS